MIIKGNFIYMTSRTDMQIRQQQFLHVEDGNCTVVLYRTSKAILRGGSEGLRRCYYYSGIL